MGRIGDRGARLSCNGKLEFLKDYESRSMHALMHSVRSRQKELLRLPSSRSPGTAKTPDRLKFVQSVTRAAATPALSVEAMGRQNALRNLFMHKGALDVSGHVSLIDYRPWELSGTVFTWSVLATRLELP